MLRFKFIRGFNYIDNVTADDIGRVVAMIRPPRQQDRGKWYILTWVLGDYCQLEWINQYIPLEERIYFTSLENLTFVR